MSFSDKIAVAQIIIGLVTVAIVGWYTEVTRRLQREARKQTDVQTTQLQMARETAAQKETRERIAAMPRIRWRAGSTSGDVETRDFENVGGTAYDLTWHPPTHIGLVYHPRGVLKPSEPGQLNFSGAKQSTFPLHFSLDFMIATGEKWLISYKINLPGGSPTEISREMVG